MRAIKFLVSFVFLFALMLIIVAGLVLFQALEQKPLVTAGAPPTAADAARARSLVKRTLGAAFSPADEVTLTASAGDVRSMLAIVTRAVPRARAQVGVDQAGMRGAVTVPLPVPDNPLGRYLNLDVTLAPSDDGLDLRDARFGGFTTRYGYRVLQGVRLIGDAVVGDEIVSRAIDAVRRVEFEGQRMRVTFAPVKDMNEDLRAALDRLRGVALAASDPATVAVYFERIAALHKAEGRASNISLARYLGPMAALASQRSQNADAAAENEAMLMAMALYFTKTEFFERLIGKVRKGELANIAAATGQALLSGRNDLMQHFLVSAALQVLANNGITYTIGEFKELLDSNRGGSGFSFVDLAADRAGVRFAEVLTDPATAKKAQALLARGGGEGVFAPRMTDLPEKMTDAEFRSTYRSVEDKAYRAMVEEIDRRIAGCVLYGT